MIYITLTPITKASIKIAAIVIIISIATALRLDKDNMNNSINN